MTMKEDIIIEACMPILMDARIHRNNGQRAFMTAYQVWGLMNHGSAFCQNLLAECGPAVGKGGGDLDGPVKRIAMALGRSDLIETDYLDTRGIWFNKSNTEIVRPSGETCGLFRLRDNTET